MIKSTKKVTKFYEVESKDQAENSLKVELHNWTWLDALEKAATVLFAKYEKITTKHGPVYKVTFHEYTYPVDQGSPRVI